MTPVPVSRYFYAPMLSVYSWGRGEDGQLGLGDTNDQDRPVLVEALKCKGVVQVACGSGHTVVLSGKSTADNYLSMCSRQLTLDGRGKKHADPSRVCSVLPCCTFLLFGQTRAEIYGWKWRADFLLCLVVVGVIVAP